MGLRFVTSVRALARACQRALVCVCVCVCVCVRERSSFHVKLDNSVKAMTFYLNHDYSPLKFHIIMRDTETKTSRDRMVRL